MLKSMRVVSVISVILLFACGMVFAQEQEETVNEAYGFVADVTADSITLEVWNYDEETDEESTEEVTYIVPPDVEIENAESLSAIEEGQDVDIEYKEEGGKKIAEYIYVYTE